MAIIISKNGKNAEKIDPSNFELEDKLQEYIYDNPDAIPLYDIDEDTRLFIAAREFNTKSGPIDALGFDAHGNIYVVETKLYKNPDKRTVVAQALDYGASLWRNAIDFDVFMQQLDAHTHKQFGTRFQDAYTEFFGIQDTAENLQAIRNNLSDGVIKFVVLMDRMHDALKDLVIFVNQNSTFDLYAVELEYYKHDQFEIIIPKLFGAEVKKEVSSPRSGSARRSWNEAEFIEDTKKQLADPAPVLKMYEFSKKIADRIKWGTGTTAASANVIFDHINVRSVYTLKSNGEIGLNFGWLNNTEGGGNDATESYRDALRTALDQAGFIATSGQKDYWFTLKYDQWSSRIDELMSIISKTLRAQS